MAGMPDIPSPAVLKEAGYRETAALAQIVAQAMPGESVHGVRRRIKQLRSLLRLLRPALGEEAYSAANSALREAADALAGQRRAEALVTAAGKLGKSADQHGYWPRLADSHRMKHAAEGDPARELVIARAAIERAAGVLGAADLTPDSEDTIIGAFAATYRKARRQLRAGLASGAPDALHEARKFVIHHLHHVKVLQPHRKARLVALEALRERLGDLNDLDELEQLAAHQDIPRGDAKLLRKARRRLLGEVDKAASRLFRSSPARFERRCGHAVRPHSPRGRAALQAGE